METCPSLAQALPLREIRSFLTPIWMRIHRSDLSWRRSTALPDTPSYAMCRHATAFLRRLMLDADRESSMDPRSPASRSTRWRTVAGQIDPARMPKAPAYLVHDRRHFAMMDEAGHVIDLTADQFGLDPLTVAHWSLWFAEAPEPSSPGLAASAREWSRQHDYRHLVSAIPSGQSHPFPPC